MPEKLESKGLRDIKAKGVDKPLGLSCRTSASKPQFCLECFLAIRPLFLRHRYPRSFSGSDVSSYDDSATETLSGSVWLDMPAGRTIPSSFVRITVLTL